MELWAIIFEQIWQTIREAIDAAEPSPEWDWPYPRCGVLWLFARR